MNNTESQEIPRSATLQFTWPELSGSFGDLGTFLPLAVVMATTCDLDLGVILITAGVANLFSGLYFRQPIPVQPMKAIAAVAIAERMAAGEIAAAGLIMAVLMLCLSSTSAIGWAVRRVPKAIIWGVQAGVGAKLALTGVTWLTGFNFNPRAATSVTGLPWIGWDSLLVAALVAVLLLAPQLRRSPRLLVVFAAGFGLLWLDAPDACGQMRLGWPNFAVTWPAASQWQAGLMLGALPQLPLTLLNSVVAICALSADYFPGRGVAPRRMAFTIGLVNLFSAPFGGIPMCYGAGGLAAQWRFGARTGGSAIILGTLKIAAGLLFGATLVGLLGAYPVAILAVMIIFAGVALASSARRVSDKTELAIVISTAVPILVVNVTVGFLIGAALAVALYSIRRPRSSP